MNTQSFLLTLILLLFLNNSSAQQSTSYVVPRTVDGHPDMQGTWVTNFVTLLERPDGVQSLVVSAEQAAQIASSFQAGFIKGNTDPDFEMAGQLELTKVNGEYRTSIIVNPEDGKIPYSEAGLELAREVDRLFVEGVNGPEQRPLEERCLGSFGYPPIRSLPLALPRLIVQNEKYVVFHTEDASGFRLIYLHADAPTEDKRRYEGYSIGHWEGDTLVVETTHFLDQNPARLNIGRPVLISANTKITERFTRVATTEIVYQYTVTDGTLYTGPWSGEFTFRWFDDRVYEYACHEGNYSMPGILRGGQLQTQNSGI